MASNQVHWFAGQVKGIGYISIVLNMRAVKLVTYLELQACAALRALGSCTQALWLAGWGASGVSAWPLWMV
eukprot:scaffold302109_cov55-Prasinocladus_malaysianus.AAC.1